MMTKAVTIITTIAINGGLNSTGILDGGREDAWEEVVEESGGSGKELIAVIGEVDFCCGCKEEGDGTGAIRR